MNIDINEIKQRAERNLTVEVLEEVDSTNSEMKRRIRSESGMVPDLLIAKTQSAGRGRQGKSFYSPRDCGIYMTFRFSFSESQNVVYVTTKTAVAVCNAIRTVTGLDVKIKWVNDIYLNGKKVCGILCEDILSSSDGDHNVLIGIGINMIDAVYPQDIPNAASLQSNESNALIAEIIDRLDLLLYEEKNKSYMDEYRQLSCVLGKNVEFVRNGNVYRGTAVSINDHGHLNVISDDGAEHSLNSGEITLRCQ